MSRAGRNALVIENLPLVGYLVRDVSRRATHLSRDDLASVGALALITAADSFDASLGVPFGAFARRRILGAFADEMRSSDWAPRAVRSRIKQTMAVSETLTAALGRTPTVDEIAASLGVDRATVRETLQDGARIITPLEDADAESITAIAMPEDSLLAEERFDYLRAGLSALPERMRYIVEQVYLHDRPVKDIALELGITHSAVSQQRSEALRLMREGFHVHYDRASVRVDADSRSSETARRGYISRFADAIDASHSRMRPRGEPAA